MNYVGELIAAFNQLGQAARVGGCWWVRGIVDWGQLL